MGEKGKKQRKKKKKKMGAAWIHERVFAPKRGQSGESSIKQKKGEEKGEGKAWRAKGEAREFYWL